MTRLPRALIVATTLVLSMTAGTYAAVAPRGSTTLGSGPIFAPTQNFFFCEFINLGTSNITPTAQQVFQYGSTVALSTGDTCTTGAAVAPNQTCYIAPDNALPDDALSCKVTFSGPVTNVRGVMQIYDSSFNSLSTTELH